MARMKIEVQHQQCQAHGVSWRDRLIAYLPRYAPYAAALRGLINLRDRLPGVARLSERLVGLSARRTLPAWHAPWTEPAPVARLSDVRGDGLDIVLFADTFNRYMEPENLAAAHRVLSAAGYRLHAVMPASGTRPLCCGRTFLATGLVDEARFEAERTIDTLLPYVSRGTRVVGLEPSCLLTLRDEALALRLGAKADEIGRAALLLEELLAADLKAGVVRLALADQGGRVAHLHGHCHQKAFDVMGPVEAVLAHIPGLDVRPIESSCCGMAGAFGYAAATYDASIKMAELSLFPALRKAGKGDLVVADGTSCRHQIADGLGREALHVVRVLDQALKRP